ncbi:hypothetical protein [Flexivirga oryzae]|uniref:Uncharacterized protein n=1 Tax=Flexivirga oryzae TaxID=1794944 RepID=A0A839N600_9MICO|nr:hypothetical protein [Flexivirga oryzae]MBB2892199.1 hypothetical protein [Flexivirga oryzae]
MGTIVSAAVDICASLQSVTVPLLLGGIVAGALRLHWLGGRRG